MLIRGVVSSPVRGVVDAPVKGEGGFPFVNPEATAYVARMDPAPDDARKALIDTLFSSLKSAGVLSKLDALWLMAAHAAQAGRLNLVSASYELSAINGPSFTTDRGYQGDGSSSYLKTGLVLSTAAKFTRNSASLGFWSLTNSATDTFTMGARVNFDNKQNIIAPRSIAGNLEGRVNVGASPGGAATGNSLGLSSASRTAPTTTNIYKNGVSASTYTNASVAPPALELYLLGGNGNGSLNLPTQHRGAVAFAGSGLDGTEMLDLYNALNTYLTAIGAV